MLVVQCIGVAGNVSCLSSSSLSLTQLTLTRVLPQLLLSFHVVDKLSMQQQFMHVPYTTWPYITYNDTYDTHSVCKRLAP